MVMHDLQVVVGHRPGHNVVHSVGKGQGQVMGLALAQHLGQIPLGVYAQHQDSLSLQRKTGPQVVDGGAFANPALLVCYTLFYLIPNTFGFAILENRRLYMGIEKAALSAMKRRLFQSDST